jgi:RHS repeat-associated protein
VLQNPHRAIESHSGLRITIRYAFGQEEDKESGLYYYKARYYDPVMGRFAQADSVAFPERIQGMNRMMYVEGNPIKYGDESGNRISTPLAWGLIGAVWAKQNGQSAEEGFAMGICMEMGSESEKKEILGGEVI